MPDRTPKKSATPAAPLPRLTSDSAAPAWFRPRIALLLILCLAAFLRLYQITTIPPGLYHDEAMNGSNILENLETHSLHVFYPENNGREGLYIDVATPFVAAFGNTAWVLRLPATIVGILTVLGVYFLGVELFSESIGLLAAFLIATSLWHVHFSRMAFRSIMSPLFLVWAVYLLLVGLRRLRDRRPHLVWLVSAGIVYALGFYTYIAYRATPLLMAAILLHYWADARKQGWIDGFYKGAGVMVGVAIVAFAPLGLYFLQNPGTFFGRSSQISVMSNASPAGELVKNTISTALMFFTAGDPNWRHNISGRPELDWPVAIFFAIGIVIAIRALFLRDPDARLPYAVAFGWLVLAALPVVFSDEGMPHALRAILMTPAVFLLAAVGAYEIYTFLTARINPTAVRVVGALLLACLCLNTYDNYFNVWAKNPQVGIFLAVGSNDVADRINALPRETPKYVIVVSGGGLVNGIPMPAQPVMYLTHSYTKKEQQERNIRYIVAPARSAAEAGAVCQQVASQLTKGAAFCL